MPSDLPTLDIAAMRELLQSRQPNMVTTITQLAEASRANLSELKAATAKLQGTQQQLVQTENELSELKIRQIEADRLVQERTTQAVKLESDLRLAQTRLAQSGTEIASLQKAVADLQDRLKAIGGPSASKAIKDLVGELRADAADLFVKPFRAADNPAAPGVVVDGLEFEIRGDLVIGEKVGLRTFAADQSDPAAASIVRFSLKPEMRIEVPDESKK